MDSAFSTSFPFASEAVRAFTHSGSAWNAFHDASRASRLGYAST